MKTPLSASPAVSALPAAKALLPRRYVVLGMVLVLGLAGLVLSWWYVPGYGAGVDEASYFLAAKGLAVHGDPAYRQSDPTVFVPENMVEARPGVFYPKYPIGYPLLCALAIRIGGLEGAFWVNPILLLVALVGVFFLVRLFVDEMLAVAAALFMGIHPAVLHYGVAALSHAADLCCVTWGMFFAVWWFKGERRWWRFLPAGVLLGYAVSIRYTEALLALPAGYLWACAVWDAWKGGEARKGELARRAVDGVAGVVGGIVGMMPLLIYQWKAFGSPLTTGYSLTGEAGAFSGRSFVNHFGFAVWTLLGISTGVSVLLPLAVAGMAWGLKRARREAVFLVLWCVPTLLLYSAYYWVNREEPVLYVRFYLTFFPALIVAALLCLTWVAGRRRILRYAVAAGIFAMAAVNLLASPNEGRFEGTAIRDLAATELAKKNLPADAVVVADLYSAYTLAYYTDMTLFYPNYFDALPLKGTDDWVGDRLRPAEADRPADFNPLRQKRFAEALGGKSTAELAAMLREKLLAAARAGRTVGLVVFKDSPAWYDVLRESFDFVEAGTDEVNGVVVYRLRAKQLGRDPVGRDPAIRI